ncbi:hypothetical protein C8F04DRAFT_1265087 [Mycena alexandri]|uniref:Uncharacterized protein n=1 Tax=Mycena alexandri TaxID=1745969 RepID=A0AAD6SKY3_9AGAR|nr:hypothetical protein C8F04DRAFT_1265087 [Mycena alexandri]
MLAGGIPNFPPTTTGAGGAYLGSSEPGMFVIDPVLATPGANRAPSDDSPGETQVLPSSDGGSPSPRISAQSKNRVRVTKNNAVYGKVEGAKRGADKFIIPRTRELRPVITDRAEATRRFMRLVTDLLERCEQVSHETGCWLYFTAQHTSAREPFLHFASPRIRREAKAEVEDITNRFNRLFLSLIAARNQETKELHKKLLAAMEKGAQVEKDLADARDAERTAIIEAEASKNELAFRDAEIAKANAELEFYKAKLRLAESKGR